MLGCFLTLFILAVCVDKLKCLSVQAMSSLSLVSSLSCQTRAFSTSQPNDLQVNCSRRFPRAGAIVRKRRARRSGQSGRPRSKASRCSRGGIVKERRRGWERKRLQVEVVRRADYCRSPTFNLTFLLRQDEPIAPRAVGSCWRLTVCLEMIIIFQFCANTKKKQNSIATDAFLVVRTMELSVGCRGYAQSIMHDVLHACELKLRGLQSCIASLQTW